MAKILIDLSKLKNLNCGLGQVSLNIGKNISQLSNANDFLLFVPKKYIGYFGNEAHYRATNFLSNKFSWLYPKIDVCHSVHQMPYFIPPNGVNVILTIHDLNFIFEKKSDAKSNKYLRRMQKLVDKASVLVFISNFVKNMANEYLFIPPEKYQTVIYNGVEIDTNREVLKPSILPKGKFLFTISEVKEKKKLLVLLDFMKRISPEYKLIIAGNTSSAYARMLENKIKQKGLSERVIMPGMISEDDKIYFYKHCTAFLFPSLYEGFGLPVIEAMRFGKPIFSSTSTSLPEVAGELAFYWESFDPDSMAKIFNEKMKIYNFQPDYATRLKEYSQKFSWKENIEQYNQLYKRLY